MIDDIEKTATDMMVEAGIDREAIARLAGIGYFMAPASANHHLAFSGGLLNHSLNVTKALLKLTCTFGVEWERQDGPIYVGMLHDLVKCKCYRESPTVVKDGVNVSHGGYVHVDPGYPGHGQASVIIARELGIELKKDEAAAIRWHMGLFDVPGVADRRDFSLAIEEFGPQVLATHFADWYSAAVDEKTISVG